MADHTDLGKKGEEITITFLKSKGYTILETNWRYGKNEIDIIAKDNSGRYLVIVEVKTRRSLYGGDPEAAVTFDKQKALIRAANAYVRVKSSTEEIRFDIVSIVVKQEGEKIKHIEDAFYPTLR